MKQGFLWTPLALALVSSFANAATAARTASVIYNAAGLVESVDGPRTDVSDVTRYTYDTQGNLSKVTNALGHAVQYEDYDSYGSPGKVTDANGTVLLLTYTPEGWLLSVSRDANGSPAVTTMSYDSVGNVIQTSDPDGVVVHYVYDEANRLTDIVDGAGNRIHYTLDLAGNKNKEETIDADGTVRRTLSRSFNSLSQLLVVTDALNRTVLSFDLADGYDAQGHPIHSRDGKGVQRKLRYDALNRLVATIDDYNGTTSSTANAQSVSNFDNGGYLTSIEDPSGLTTRYSLNGLGDLTAIDSPDAGMTTFSVDAAGNRLNRTDARGVVTTYEYDALNRLISAKYPDHTLDVAYRYDEANSVTGCPVSAPVGRLTRIVEAAVTTVYCYDARGNVAEKRQIQGAVTDTLRYAYTPGNRIASEVRPSGNVITYRHDAMGHVSEVNLNSADGTHAIIASGISWLPFGPMQAYTLGNGQTVTRRFDANYRITDIVSPPMTLRFSRDEIGNIISATESDRSESRYLYDPLYRLTSLDDISGSAIEAYTYNPAGDRMSKLGVGNHTGAYGYKPGTHWLISMGAAPRTYDANGNTTSSAVGGDVWLYEYNDRNRMAVVQRNGIIAGTYLYNASGERVAKTVGTTSVRFVYDERSQLLVEANSTDYRDYVSVEGVPLAIADGSSIGFVVADALGSPRAVTSSDGALRWSWPYAANPFGENQPISTSGYVLNLRFPGQYADGESTLHYNIHRYFDTATGRYLQSDPIGLAGGRNTYSYVFNSPLSFVDPLGLAATAFANGKSLMIVLPIAYIGTPQKGWNDAISNRWSGVFGDVSVTTVVTQGAAMSVDTNLITVGSPGSRSFVSFYSTGKGQDTGTWASDASNDVVSHEAGHLLHLQDRYVDVPDSGNPWGVRSIPLPGYENNIMSNVRMRPSEADVFEIMNNRLFCK